MNYGYSCVCDRCGAAMTSFRTVYESGTMTGNVSGSVSGTIWANGLHTYSHNYNAPVTVQSELARRCAPPPAPELSGWFWGAMFFVPISFLFWGLRLGVPALTPVLGQNLVQTVGGIIAIFLFALWIAAAFAGLVFFRVRWFQILIAFFCTGFLLLPMAIINYLQYQRMKRAYPALRRDWEHSYVCTHCYRAAVIEPNGARHELA